MSATNQKTCPQCGSPLPSDVKAGLCPRCVMDMNLATPTEFTEKAGGPQSGFSKEPPPSPEDLADKFPQLEILELLGRGGMGAVYKARQKELDRIVALKILPPRAGDDPSFAERFTREAKALAKLNHPGIVTIYDFGRANGLYYFLMEYVDGASLRPLLGRERMSPREALAIVPQICDALQYAHDQGIVHRDIKPENILLDRAGRVKVADFGLAKLMESGRGFPLTPTLSPEGEGEEGKQNSLAPRGGEGRGEGEATALTEADKIIGTPQYMAPEQRDRPLEVDHRADIYSLGIVLYQMLTGELPDKRIEPPSKKVQIDVRLDEVVLRALEKNPALRYQQASLLKTQVETIALTGMADGKTNIPPENKSQLVRMLEVGFGIVFASPLAIKLINVSALGFLASLGFLGFLPAAGMRRFFVFFGFGGFFGLIGAAFMVEMYERRQRFAKIRSGDDVASKGKPRRPWIEFCASVTFGGAMLYGLGCNIWQAYASSLKILFIFLTLAALSSMIVYLTYRTASAEGLRRTFKFAAWLAWIASIPFVGFGLFFLNALIEEGLDWHPAVDEAIIVPLVMLGAGWLPVCGWRLWRAGKPAGDVEDSPSIEPVSNDAGRIQEMPPSKASVYTGVSIGALLLLTAWGNAVAMLVVSAFLLGVGLVWFGGRNFRGNLLVALAALGIAATVGMWLNRKPPEVKTHLLAFDPEFEQRPNGNVGSTLLAIQARTEFILRADRKGRLLERAKDFDYINEYFDLLQGKTPIRAATTKEQWGIEDSARFNDIMDIVAKLENDAEMMRDLVRGRGSALERTTKIKTIWDSSFALEYQRLNTLLNSPRIQAPTEPPADVADVPSSERFARGDTNMHYLVIGAQDKASPNKEGWRLLIVLPGGDGGRDFEYFIRRIYKNALPENYLVAQLFAPQWDARQPEQLVWPTRTNPYPAMEFATEDFVAAVIEDIDKFYKIDERNIFTLGWSSGGPAAYAVSLGLNSRMTGTFVAMSVFKPDQFDDLRQAKGHAYYLLHSPQDNIPIRMAENARDQLTAAGANVRLQTYEGGHGWRGDVYGNIRAGVEWLEANAAP